MRDCGGDLFHSQDGAAMGPDVSDAFRAMEAAEDEARKQIDASSDEHREARRYVRE